MRMRGICAVFVFVFLAAQLAFAQDIQEIIVALNASGVTDLVNVTNNLNFSQLVPNYEYTSTAVVNWAIPQGSLAGIKTDRIIVFVMVNVDPAIPFVYFKTDDTRSYAIPLILRCDLVDGACAPSSELAKEITYYIKLPNTATTLQDTEVFRVRASLLPFEYFTELMAERDVLNASITDLKADASNLPPSSDSLAILSRLETAQNKISLYDIQGVDAELAALRTNIDNLKARAAFSAQIGGLESELDRVVALSTTALTTEEGTVLSDASAAIDNAKTAIQDFSFNSAQQYMATAENRTATLAEMITERQKTAPERISEFLNTIAGDWVYSAITGIIVLLVLFLIALKIREGGGKQRPKSRQ